MSEDIKFVDRTNEDPYPMRGFILREDGTSDEGDPLYNVRQLYSWIDFIAIPAARSGREVMIEDNEENASFHAKGKRLIFPRQNDELRKAIEE